MKFSPVRAVTESAETSVDRVQYSSAGLAGANVAEPRLIPLPDTSRFLAPTDGKLPPRKGLLSPSLVKSGYLPRNPIVDAVLNRALALFFLAATAPLFLLIGGVLLITSGRPVIYSGARLGQGMRAFNILKFRTLHEDASAQTRDGTLPKRTLLETRIGSYLRKSRLDELPQLVNILKGDMVFFGPRPVRPNMIGTFEKEALGFHVRFEVRPGLVGMSQALLPHAASKRLRGRFVAMCCRAPTNYPAMLGFVLLVGLTVLRRSASGLLAAIADIGSPLTQFNFLRSGFARPKDATVQIVLNGEAHTAGLVGISDQVIQFATTLPVEIGDYQITISRKLASGRRLQITLEVEVNTVCPVGPGKSGFVAYATYRPGSDYLLYRIERYLLDDSVLPT